MKPRVKSHWVQQRDGRVRDHLSFSHGEFFLYHYHACCCCCCYSFSRVRLRTLCILGRLSTVYVHISQMQKFKAIQILGFRIPLLWDYRVKLKLKYDFESCFLVWRMLRQARDAVEAKWAGKHALRISELLRNQYLSDRKVTLWSAVTTTVNFPQSLTVGCLLLCHVFSGLLLNHLKVHFFSHYLIRITVTYVIYDLQSVAFSLPIFVKLPSTQLHPWLATGLKEITFFQPAFPDVESGCSDTMPVYQLYHFVALIEQ